MLLTFPGPYRMSRSSSMPLLPSLLPHAINFSPPGGSGRKRHGERAEPVERGRRVRGLDRRHGPCAGGRSF